MNTKTMRLPPRRVLTPSGTTTNKRKERDDLFERPKPMPVTTATAPTGKLFKPDRPRPGPDHVVGSSSINGKGGGGGGGGGGVVPSNQLLAGYLAHEYLTKGTLLGQPWGPHRDGEEDTAELPCRRTAEEAEVEERERYAEVAGLFKGGGTHLHGVVNPTQLARFLHS